MEDQLRCLEEDQAWMGLRQDSEAGLVPSFGSRAGALLDSCITGQPQPWEKMQVMQNGQYIVLTPVHGATHHRAGFEECSAACCFRA